jgi:hypothetical protein
MKSVAFMGSGLLGCRPAIFASTYERLATGTLFETPFVFSVPAMTPSRFFSAR